MATDDLQSVISDAHRNLQLYVEDTKRLERYYDGARRLAALGMSIPPELEHLQTVVNWPRLVVDSINERLVRQGMRIKDGQGLDDRAAQWSDSNNLDLMESAAHAESLIQGLSYISVDWDGDPNHDPTILPEPANTFWVTWDAKYRNIVSAVRFWNDIFLTPEIELQQRGQLLDPKPTMCTVYLPDTTTYFTSEHGQWVQTDRIEHNTGQVPVVPMVNNYRLNNQRGISQMTDVIPLTDAATRALTDLQAAQELYAMPKYWLLGADPNSFVDADGNPVPKWEMYLNAVNLVSDGDVKLQQTQAGQLSNYSNVLSTYAKLASSVSGIPAYYFGDSGDANPVSEGSIRASENRLVLIAEKRQRTFGRAWAKAFQIASIMVDGEPTKYQPVWQDASTPTLAATEVAVSKLFQVGLLSRRAGLEKLGYDAVEIQSILDDFAQPSAAEQVLEQLGVTGISAHNFIATPVGGEPSAPPNGATAPANPTSPVNPAQPVAGPAAR